MKRTAPAADRNKEPIAQVLERVLPETGRVLEVASGTGQHVLYFAQRMPRLTWQPTDLDDEALASIRAWLEETPLANVQPPMRLDATSDPWPFGELDAVVCINMVHIAPWSAGLGLFAGAGRHVRAGGALVLYGPFHVDHRPTAPSNAEFDEGLRARNPQWGVRDVGDVAAAAAARGFELMERVAMPANNFTLVFRRVGASPSGARGEGG